MVFIFRPYPGMLHPPPPPLQNRDALPRMTPMVPGCTYVPARIAVVLLRARYDTAPTSSSTCTNQMIFSTIKTKKMLSYKIHTWYNKKMQPPPPGKAGLALSVRGGD